MIESKPRNGRSTRVALVSLLATVAFLTLAIAPALAVKTHPFISSFRVPGALGTASGVAINETTHHVYAVNETEPQNGGGIYEFDSDGNLVAQLVSPPDFQPFTLAIDNLSGGATAGFIYVTDFNRGIQQYDEAGIATTVKIDDSAIPPHGTPQVGLAPVVHDQSFHPRAIAVDGDGNVYATDDRNDQTIDKFSPSGAFIAQMDPGELGYENGYPGIAVAPSGEIYVTNPFGKDGNGLITLSPSGACVNSCAPLAGTSRSDGVAVDTSGSVFVTEPIIEESPFVTKQVGSVVKEFDPSGALISQSSSPQVPWAFRIAVDSTTGRLYVGDVGNDPRLTVKILGPLLTLPDATTEDASGVTDHGAVFHGVVGADGGPAATCLFQYTTDAAFKAQGFEGSSTVPCSPAGPFTGEGTTAVEASVSDLNGGTGYHYRLLASSSAGSSPGADRPFGTPGPQVVSQRIADLTDTSARFEGEVNPRKAETSYSFQYVSQAEFEANGYANALVVPLGGQPIGAGETSVKVSQTVAGLAVHGTYHVRLAATSSVGSAVGPDTVFTTYLAAITGLPDGRAYEQASPVDKNGTSALGEPNAVKAAPDGGAVTFFATSGIPGGEGSAGFPSYLATRAAGGSGWLTQGLLPPAATGPESRIDGWSEDLSQVYVSSKPIGSANVFYERRNADRSLRAIVTGDGTEVGSFPFSFAAASAGGDEVLFEAKSALAPGAVAGKSNVYVWHRTSGAVSLAGVMNDGQAPAKGAFAGPYDWFLKNDTEGAGGAAGQYDTQGEHVLSQDGSKAFFTAAGSGQIYLRLNPSEEQSPLDGAGNCTNSALACTIRISATQRSVPDPAGDKPAAFLGATPDGSAAFFLSTAKLTSDATAGAGSDLYRYDVASGELTDLTPDPGPGGAQVQGLLGISDDGAHVYFAANGVLDAGATPGNCARAASDQECSIYVAHGSDTSFIARVKTGGEKSAPPSFNREPFIGDEFNWSPTYLQPDGGHIFERTARVTPDGLTLLFRTNTRQGAYPNQGFAQLYRYRAGDSAPTCVSCVPTGLPPISSAAMQFAKLERFGGINVPSATTTRNLSSDGDRIFFESADKLVVSDTNGVNDVYEWEEKGSGSCTSEEQNGGCLYLISSGTSPEPSYFADASLDGGDVFFFTEQGLVRQDGDELGDVYDARVGGGIAAQNPLPVVPCAGEDACRSQTPGAPASPSAGSATFSGPTDPKPVRSCQKKSRHKCHKTKPKKHKKHRKQTSQGRTHR